MGQDNQADVAACWDRNADQWTHDVRSGYDLYRDLFTFPAFLAFLPPIKGLDVVDFGCGEGTNTRRFARMGGNMTGIDLSSRMIQLASLAEQSDPLGITFKRTSNSAHIGYADASFDAVVSTMALMDGPDLDGAMREAYRVLRPGGFLAFSVLHPCFITPGTRWVKDDLGKALALSVSRYFQTETFTDYWSFSDRPKEEPVQPFAVPRFPRSISTYLNAVAKSGLQIERVEEPVPSSEACEVAPRFARWREIAGLILLVLARRPSA